MSSEAWRGRSINCVRLIEFLTIEHMANAGQENGRLSATYRQLEGYGIARRYIPAAIAEAVQRGLVSVERGGRRGTTMTEMSRFRLTFYATRDQTGPHSWTWESPTDEWRRYSTDAAKPSDE